METTSGFANCIKGVDYAPQHDTASFDANKFIILEQRFEGQDATKIYESCHTSDAKEYASFFLCKQSNASEQATMIAELFETRLITPDKYSKTFSVTTSWTRLNLTFPARYDRRI